MDDSFARRRSNAVSFQRKRRMIRQIPEGIIQQVINDL